MANLTRIKNNQITDSTILANTKIVPGSIVGSLFNSNLVMTSDVTITGNLTVQGTGTYLTIASTNTYVNDPLIVMNNAFSGTNTYDLGFVFNRGTLQTQAFIWSEPNKEFRLIGTTETGTTYGTVTTSSYANLRVGNLFVESGFGISSLSITGFINTSGNISGALVNAGQINSTGNVLAQAATFNNLTVNGDINSTGFIDTTGNISGAVIHAGSINSSGYINTSGNVSAAAYTGGSLNVTGNVLASAYIGASINVSGNVLASTVLAQLVTSDDATFGNVAAGFIGNTGTQFTGASINLSGNVLAVTVGASYVTASTATFGNISAVNFGNTGATFTGSSLNVSGNVSAAIHMGGAVNVSGNVLASSFVGGAVNVSGNVLATTVGASYVTASTATFGNISAVNFGNTGAIFTGASLNASGNVSASLLMGGAVNVSGNVLASSFVGGSVDVSGNVLASTVGASYVTASTATFGNISAVNFGNTGAIFTGATVNTTTLAASGNVIGGLAQFASINNTPIGNITASTGAFTTLSTANSLWANASIATTTQGTGAIVVPNGGISVAGAANIALGTTIGGATQLNNTLTVGGAVSVTNSTNSSGVNLGGALTIAGGAAVAKDLWVGGNLYASNIFSTTYSVLTVSDPLLYLTAANTYPYSYNIGFYSQFTGGPANVYAHTGVIRDNTDGYWKLFSNVVTEPSTVISFDASTQYDGLKVGNLILVDTTASSSTATGALQVAGGAGIAGALYAGSIQNTPIGTVTPAAGYFTTLNSSGNVLAQTVGASFVTASTVAVGNISAVNFGNTGATFTGASLNVTGNVSAAIHMGGAVNVSGNVLASSFVGGAVNVSGNVLASTVGASFVTASSIAVGNISAVNFGNTGATFTGASLNVSGNVLASTVGASYVTASTATFGNISAATIGNTGAILTGASLNVSGNVLAFDITANTLNASGNVLAKSITTGFINSTGNVLAQTVGASYVTASTATFGNISAVTIGNTGAAITGATVTSGTLNISGNVLGGLAQFAAINDTPIGNASPSTGVFTYIIAGNVQSGFVGNAGTIFTGASLNASGNVLAQAGTFNDLTVHGNEVVTGYLNVTGNVLTARVDSEAVAATGVIYANSTATATTTTTGAVRVAGGVGVAGNVHIGGSAVINESQTQYDFQVKGTTTTSLIYASSNYGALVFGGSNVSPQLGSVVKFNSADSVLLPVGTTAQRPSNTGNVDVTGMMRFNTTRAELEYYDGSTWKIPGSTYTVITDQQFNGDNVSNVFTLTSSSTTNATVVSINGVIQIPTLAYSVSGTSLVFTESPALGDIIDVRVLATMTSITSLTSQNGYASFDVASPSNLYANITAGTASATVRVSVDAGGVVNLVNGSKLGYNQTDVTVTTSPVIVDTFDITKYRSAKYVITFTQNGGSTFESTELLAIHNGTTAYMNRYANVSTTGSSLATYDVTIVSGELRLECAANSGTGNVKVLSTYTAI